MHSITCISFHVLYFMYTDTCICFPVMGDWHLHTGSRLVVSVLQLAGYLYLQCQI